MKAVRLVFTLIAVVAALSSGYAQTLSKKDTANVHFLNARKFFIYKVEKGETLYGIAQKFKIPQEEILQFNHEIEKSGLKPKMKLWIPAYSWLKKDSVPEIVIEENPAKTRFNVAVITGLNLPKIYLEKDTSAGYIDEAIGRETQENLEFIEGIMHSADKLKSIGLKVHLTFIDSESDSIKVLRKLKKDQFSLIITNESGNILKTISDYSKQKTIRLFSYSLNATDVIKSNPNAFAFMPSSATQCNRIGKFAARYFANSVLVTVKTPVYKENERTDQFKSGWMESRTGKIINVDYQKGGNTAIADSLIKDKTNVIFISSSNEDLVSTLLNSLRTKIPEYRVMVVGLPTWQFFETVDQNILETCNVHLFSSGMIEYNSAPVTDFRKFFRDKYNSEPAESAYYGFDVMNIAGSYYLKNGTVLVKNEKDLFSEGMFTDYNFKRSGDTGAYENDIIHVFQPSRDAGVDLMKNFKMQ